MSAARSSLAIIPALIALSVSAWSPRARAATMDDIEGLMKDGEYARARTLVEDLLSAEPHNARALSILSQIHLTEEDAAAARDAAGWAVELQPDNAEYRMWLARAYLLRASQSTLLSLWYAWKGKGQYEKAVELEPENAQIRLELCLYYLLAPGIAGGGKGKAREQAGAIEELDPLFGAYAWASVWERQKDLERAEDYLMRAVDMDTSSTFQAKYSLAYFYHRNEEFADARSVFEDILAADSTQMSAMYHIGATYVLEEKDLDRAEHIFKRYLMTRPGPDQPSHAMAHWRLGMVYDLRGESDPAMAEFERAVALEPDNRQFKAALDAAKKD